MIEHSTVPLGQWHTAAEEARAEGFSAFDLLTAVDQLDDSTSPGVDVVLHLRRPADGAHRWLRTRWHEGLSLRSLSDLWPGAAWREREAHEMLGVQVDGCADAAGPGLRPLLLRSATQGHPLRKSFALTRRDDRPWPGTKDPDARAGRRNRPLALPPRAEGGS